MEYENHKQYIIKYFQTENGRSHLKEAQKNYRQTEAGKQKTRELQRIYDAKKKLFKNECKSLGAIQIF